MSVATYTKTGNKSTTAAKLDKKVFGVEVKNQDLLKQSYLAYLANSRQNSAVTKKRGEVRGGGRKPWRQKGTGRARFGSIRTPLWRGGGIIFGPTGEENYHIKLSTRSKRLALRQALSLASDANKVKVVESFTAMESKTKEMVKFLTKLEADGKVLCIVSSADTTKERAAQNIPNLRVVGAKYLTVYDILNANSIIIDQKALSIISEWLAADAKAMVAKADSKVAKGSKA